MEEGRVMKNKVLITSMDENKMTHKNEKEPYEYYKQEITKRSLFQDMYVAFYQIPPNKIAYPFHYHDFNTETFYIISGEGLLISKEDTMHVKKVILLFVHQK